MKQSELKEIIRQLVREVIEEEDDLDEITTTGGVAGYNTPNAFKATDGTDEDDESDGDHVDKANKQTGYRRVTEDKLPINETHWITPQEQQRLARKLNSNVKDLEFFDFDSKAVRDKVEGKVKLPSGKVYRIVATARKGQVIGIFAESVNEVKLPIEFSTEERVNRWLELKRSDKTPNQKIGIGVRNIRYELREMNKFLKWYNKIRLENELPKDKYWKRTQSHVRKMKEHMIDVVREVQKFDSSLEDLDA